jgi:hypothetical protein
MARRPARHEPAPGVGNGSEREGRQGAIEIFGPSSILLQGAADHVSTRVCAPGPHSATGGRCGRSGRVGRGVGCGRGPSAFFEGGTMPPERPGASRHRSPRRAIPWTPGPHERWRQRPGPAYAPAPPFGSTARQAPGKDARQVEAAAGCGAYTAGKVFAEDSAILTVAGACDGTTAGLVARRTRSVVCNPIRDEPDFRRMRSAGSSPERTRNLPPRSLMSDPGNHPPAPRARKSHGTS